MKMTNLLNAALTAMRQNPAITGALASVLVTIGAQYGLHLSLAYMTTLLALANAVIFAWVHGKVSPVAPKAQ